MNAFLELVVQSLRNVGYTVDFNPEYHRIRIDGCDWYFDGAPLKPKYIRCGSFYRRYSVNQSGLTKLVVDIIRSIPEQKAHRERMALARDRKAMVAALKEGVHNSISIHDLGKTLSVEVTHPDADVIMELVRRISQLVAIDESSPEAALTSADELEEMGFQTWADRIRAQYRSGGAT